MDWGHVAAILCLKSGLYEILDFGSTFWIDEASYAGFEEIAFTLASIPLMEISSDANNGRKKLESVGAQNCCVYSKWDYDKSNFIECLTTSYFIFFSPSKGA